MKEINEKIGKRIKKLRKQTDLTQSQLAEKLKCSTTYLSRIERGVETGSLKFFVKTAKSLSVPLKAIFDFGEQEQTEVLEEIVLKIRDKDGVIKERIVKVL